MSHNQTVERLAKPMIEMARDEGFDIALAVAEGWRASLAEMVETTRSGPVLPCPSELVDLLHVTRSVVLELQVHDPSSTMYSMTESDGNEIGPTRLWRAMDDRDRGD